MARTKTEFKWFTIPQYKREEEYLRNMHKKGWALSHIRFPGFYHFTECTPEDVVYQLDYNPDGSKSKSEYIQMFSDLGWEYLFEFVGYSYFKKPVQQMDSNIEHTEEIFCDDESRLEMMKRIFQGRVYPLLIIFFALIIPQLFMQTLHSGDHIMPKGISIAYFLMFFMYMLFFITFGFQFFSFEKKIREPDNAFKTKYTILSIITLALCVFAISFVICLWTTQEDSKYTINAMPDQYSIGAEFLNETLTHELSLSEGEQLDISLIITDGEINVDIFLEGEDAIYEDKINDSNLF